MGLSDWFTRTKKLEKEEAERLMLRLINKVQLDASHNEYREERRCPLSVAVRVSPIDARGRIDQGAAFAAATRDASTDGISFVHRRSFEAEEQLHLALDVEDLYQFSCVVRHCTPIGMGLFVTGCEILGTKLLTS